MIAFIILLAFLLSFMPTLFSDGGICVIRSCIVDDDIGVNDLLPENLSNTLEEDVGDNDPTVVAFIDERPEHIKRMESYRNDDRWKVLNETKGCIFSFSILF